MAETPNELLKDCLCAATDCQAAECCVDTLTAANATLTAERDKAVGVLASAAKIANQAKSENVTLTAEVAEHAEVATTMTEKTIVALKDRDEALACIAKYGDAGALQALKEANAKLALVDKDSLEAERDAMIEDRDLWKGQHNEDCPNLAKVAALEAERDALQAVVTKLTIGLEDIKRNTSGATTGTLGAIHWAACNALPTPKEENDE